MYDEQISAFFDRMNGDKWGSLSVDERNEVIAQAGAAMALEQKLRTLKASNVSQVQLTHGKGTVSVYPVPGVQISGMQVFVTFDMVFITSGSDTAVPVGLQPPIGCGKGELAINAAGLKMIVDTL